MADMKKPPAPVAIPKRSWLEGITDSIVNAHPLGNAMGKVNKTLAPPPKPPKK